MCAASIDRYLKPAKATDQIRGVATTKPSPLLRSSIKIRKAGDEVEAEPGFFEGDTVAHCGPTLKGEFARTLNLTDVLTGWVFTRTVRNNAHLHILGALEAGVDEIPFEVTGLDFDNGSEFLNHAVIDWASQQQIFFTRSRPYKKNDQATIESKNNHLVRKYGFYYRYDTDDERAVLNRLWRFVNDRLNYLTPTKKPTGYGTDRNGRRTRVYDKPATPLDRLLAANVLSPAHRPSCSATATASTRPPSPARSPTCKPCYSSWPRTRPNSSTSPASPATSRRPQRHPHQSQLTPSSRAFLTEAPITFRGHLDMRHYVPSNVNGAASHGGVWLIPARQKAGGRSW